MKTYYASGTVGDAYIILCKLYSVAKKEKILCKHYAKYEKLEQPIREIYSLLPNIKVEFLKNEPSEIQICGAFYFSGSEIERTKYNLEIDYYPEFELPEIDYLNLPNAYEVLQIEAGSHGNRSLGVENIKEILNNAELPIILIGGLEQLPTEFQSTIDLRGKTSIKEVIKIIKNSKHFYGPVGFLSFVALSQKIFSIIFTCSKIDRSAVYNRIEMVNEWKKFLIRK